MSDVVVRPSRPEDAPALRRLVAETIEDPATVDPVAADPGAGDDVVFVAEVAGHPAGYAAVRIDGGALVIDRVMVAPADRGRHVGHRLLDWLEGYGISRGLRRVRIVVEDDNHPARDFYTRRGYADCGRALERDLPHL
jgi:ribosomal protein S18 acetylase RimI-like enzyme